MLATASMVCSSRWRTTALNLMSSERTWYAVNSLSRNVDHNFDWFHQNIDSFTFLNSLDWIFTRDTVYSVGCSSRLTPTGVLPFYCPSSSGCARCNSERSTDIAYVVFLFAVFFKSCRGYQFYVAVRDLLVGKRRKREVYWEKTRAFSLVRNNIYSLTNKNMCSRPETRIESLTEKSVFDNNASREAWWLVMSTSSVWIGGGRVCALTGPLASSLRRQKSIVEHRVWFMAVNLRMIL